VLKSVEKKKSVAGQFAVKYKYKSETYCWTKKLNKEDYGVDQYTSTGYSTVAFT